MSGVHLERLESVDNTCPVCHDIYEIYAVGPCDHPVCYRCSTRMRVLCEQMDCPICRSTMPQVAFVYKKQLFRNINLRNCIPNRKYKIFYDDEKVEERFSELLEFRCKICRNRDPEKTFAQLQTHMRREHELFACDLCVANLKIFPIQRKFYTRKTLAVHRRVGDEDDKSYKGHPLCEFCDVRYNDKDELLKHLRKDHFFCHFCDQQGSNAYYDQYPDLAKHFSESHFLCTEGECANLSTRFTHAFASDIDLKAHKAATHGKNMSKAQSREARTIELDFQRLPRRQNNRGGVFNRRWAKISAILFIYLFFRLLRDREFDVDLHRALEESKELVNSQAKPFEVEPVPDPVHDFPTLNGSIVPAYVTSAVSYSRQPKTLEEDFPILSNPNSTLSGNKNNLQAPIKQYSSLVNPPVDKKPLAPAQKESKPVSLGSVSRAPRERWSTTVPKITEDEYPALGAGVTTNDLVSNSANSSSNWIKVGKPVGIVHAKKTTYALDNNSPFKFTHTLKTSVKDENDFPCLDSGGSRGNKVFPFTEKLKLTNGSSDSKIKKPKSEKYDDAMFELPESYYTSFESSSEKQADSALEAFTVVEKRKTTVPSSKSFNDFPELPSRENKVSVTSVSGYDKKKINKKKKENKSSFQPKSAPSQEINASLNEIAQALVKGSTKQDEKHGSVLARKLPKPTDWFDNPQVEAAETIQQPKKVEKSPPLRLSGLSLTSPPFKVDDNFPSLHAMSTSVQQPKPPPGFSAEPLSPVIKVTSPIPAPPGFKIPPSTPPGFIPSAVYIQPVGFKERNLKLVGDIRQALAVVEQGFDSFKALSAQFRQGATDASHYYFSCQALMGDEKFVNIFPELLALLPDIGKQQELWKVHQASIGRTSKSSSGTLGTGEVETPSTAHWLAAETISQCYICGQVILRHDSVDHQRQHTGFIDFSSLGTTVSNASGVVCK
ncbi:unnamed protein product [Lymnaea stagnalis]|uniref:RING-type E3 ubiquitin transferase n=1 Tax=Lymnaea stagnalis TaxID=6523 RepID=A0AAV2II14_LYMST